MDDLIPRDGCMRHQQHAHNIPSTVDLKRAWACDHPDIDRADFLCRSAEVLSGMRRIIEEREEGEDTGGEP